MPRATPPSAATAHVALLRGLNVGGNHALPMRALAALFTEAGCTSVATYIQSGNVVFRAAPAVAALVPARIAKAIADGYGFEAPVTTRSAAELAAVLEGNPYLKAGCAPETLHVGFLAAAPAPAAVAALDPARSPSDRFTVLGREIFLHCPGGYGGTKLTNQYFDARLATTSTVRNWRTVLALFEMAKG